MWASVTCGLALAVVGSTGCKSKSQAPAPSEGGEGQLAAASASGTASAGGEVPSEFVWMGVDPANIDPAFVQDMAAWWIDVNIFEGLTMFPPDNGPARPGVAKLPAEQSPDGLTWTFHLRDNATWTDGKPVVAHDFVYAWRRAVNPETASKVADDFRFLQNALAIMDGSEKDLSKLGVEATDDHTLVLRLRHPVPTLEARLATPPFFPVRQDVVEKHDKQWTRAENLVTNGPYRLAEWSPRERIVFEKNERWWDAQSVTVARSVMLHIEAEDLAWDKYQKGELHWLMTIPAERVSDLLAQQHPDLIMSPLMCTAGVQLKLDAPPFDNPEVRRAIALAIDRERLVKQILKRGDVPWRGYVPKAMVEAVGYSGAEQVDYDPDEARRVLAAAGYPGGVGLPPITYIFNTYAANRTIGEFLQRNLSEDLGIDVKLENMEFRAWVKRLRAGEFQWTRHAGCGQPDPVTWVEVFLTGGASNSIGFSNPELDALVEQINQTPSIAKQLPLVKRAEQMILDSHAIIPLYSPYRAYLVKPFVHGFEVQASDIHPLRYIRLGER